MDDTVLNTMMQAAVLLRIQQFEDSGGPTKEDMDKAQETSAMLGESGEILLFGGGKQGLRAELFNRTAHAVAVLAFAPGGVHLFGCQFEAKRKENADGDNTL